MRTVLLLVTFVSALPAQSMIAAKAGLISYAQGDVFLNDKPLIINAVKWPQMQADELIRSGFGRAELLLNPCVVLHLDRNSSLRMVANHLNDTRVELVSGTAIVQSDRKIADTGITLSVRGALVPITKIGLYRFDATLARLKVVAGKAVVEKDGSSIVVGTGRSLSLQEDPPTLEKFDPHVTDMFDWWSRSRVRTLARNSGLTDLQRKQRIENAEAARRMDSMQAQTRDSRSGQFDPNAPISPVPYPAPGFGGAPPYDRPRVCDAWTR